MPPPLRFATRVAGLFALTCLGLLALSAFVARAQAPADDVEEDEASVARLTVYAATDGSLSVSLLLPTPTPSPALLDAFARAFGSGPAAPAVQEIGALSITSLASARPLARRGLMREGAFELAPLLRELHAGHVSSLEVQVTHPRVPYAALSAAGVIGARTSDWARELILTPDDRDSAPAGIAFGFRPRDAAIASLSLFALFLFPLVAVAALRAAALRAPGPDPAPAWFGYCRGVNVVALGLWPAWFAGMHWLYAASLFEWLIPGFAGPYAGSLSWPLLMVPPLLAGIVINAITYDLSARMRGHEQAAGELVTQSVWRSAALLAAITGLSLAIAAAGRGAPRLAAVAGLAAIAGVIGFVRLQLRARGMAPHAVTHGELRDSLFALARKAGVQLQQLYVLPMTRLRTANAFAVRGNMVWLTDYLLQHLSRREVNAVMAHEIAHLKRRHPLKLALVLSVTLAVTLTAMTFIRPSLASPLAVLIAPLAMVAAARRFEGEADDGAVALCGDPEALITGLARLSRLNHVPLDWRGPSTRLLTHPSTVRRARAIALRAGLAPERVDVLLNQPLAPDALYALPETARLTGKIFSTPFKQGAGSGVMLRVVAASVLAPALVVLASRAWGPDARGAVFAIASAAAIVAAIATWNALAGRPYLAILRRLRARLASQGFDPGPATLTGLSPGAAPRIYEGFSDWDLGFLALYEDRLCFAGEETRFALRRDQVTALDLVPGLPSWIPAPRVCVAWRDEANDRAGRFTVRPAGKGSVSSSGRETRRLHDSLAAWRQGHIGLAPATGGWLTLSPPAIGEVTSLSPRAIGHPRGVVFALYTLAILAACAAGLLGLPFAPTSGVGFLEVLGAAFIAALVQRVPYWRHREPAAAPEAPAGDPQRRAA